MLESNRDQRGRDDRRRGLDLLADVQTGHGVVVAVSVVERGDWVVDGHRQARGSELRYAGVVERLGGQRCGNPGDKTGLFKIDRAGRGRVPFAGAVTVAVNVTGGPAIAVEHQDRGDRAAQLRIPLDPQASWRRCGLAWTPAGAVPPPARNADPVPVMLLARLALDRSKQGRHLGGHLLVEALRRCARGSREFGARAVIVDAINDQAADFYATSTSTASTNGACGEASPISRAPSAPDNRRKDRKFRSTAIPLAGRKSGAQPRSSSSSAARTTTPIGKQRTTVGTAIIHQEPAELVALRQAPWPHAPRSCCLRSAAGRRTPGPLRRQRSGTRRGNDRGPL